MSCCQYFQKNGIKFEQEVPYTEFPDIEKALGVDKKRFDFVISTMGKINLIETNFYTSGGSKLNEITRSYSDLASKINAIPGYEFVWITDGSGWKSAKNKLEEALAHIPRVYNLTSISEFVNSIK